MARKKVLSSWLLNLYEKRAEYYDLVENEMEWLRRKYHGEARKYSAEYRANMRELNRQARGWGKEAEALAKKHASAMDIDAAKKYTNAHRGWRFVD